MADVDTSLVQKVFHISQRERKRHIHHNGQPDDLGARLKVTKGGLTGQRDIFDLRCSERTTRLLQTALEARCHRQLTLEGM